MADPILAAQHQPPRGSIIDWQHFKFPSIHAHELELDYTNASLYPGFDFDFAPRPQSRGRSGKPAPPKPSHFHQTRGAAADLSSRTLTGGDDASDDGVDVLEHVYPPEEDPIPPPIPVKSPSRRQPKQRTASLRYNIFPRIDEDQVPLPFLHTDDDDTISTSASPDPPQSQSVTFTDTHPALRSQSTHELQGSVPSLAFTASSQSSVRMSNDLYPATPDLKRRPMSALPSVSRAASSTSHSNHSSVQIAPDRDLIDFDSYCTHSSKSSSSGSFHTRPTSSKGFMTSIRSGIKSVVPIKHAIIEAAKVNDIAEIHRLTAGSNAATLVQVSDKDGMTALHWAAQNGHVETARTLVERGAALEVLTRSQQRTPLFLAAQRDHVQVVELLLAHGAAPDSAGKMDGATAIHKAAQVGAEKSLQLLVARGAGLNRRDIEGQTPLMWALHGKQVGTARALCAAGAKLEMRIRLGANLELASKQGITILYKAVQVAAHAFIRMLLEHGADPNTEALFGLRPLHQAATKGDMVAAAMLLEFGADVNALSEDGWTPLHSAARYGHKRICQLLVRSGAEPAIRTIEDGYTAFEIAKKWNHELTI